MSETFEILVGKLCLEKGWLQPAQLAECLKASSATSTPLSQILVQKHAVRPEQIEALRQEVEGLLEHGEYTVVRREDELLGQILVREKAVKIDDLRRALTEQDAEKTSGDVPRLGEILLRDGAISLASLEDALQRQSKKTALACVGCGATYHVVQHEPEKRYLCKKCGGTLAPPGETPRTLPTPGTARAAKAEPEPDEVRRVSGNPKNRLGKYVIVKELGRGGMGAVYKAWDTSLRRWVAVKLLTGSGKGEDLARFQREAQTAASLKHPNIVGVYEVGEANDHPFIAMEYVDGKTLAGQRFPAKRCAEIMVDVATAVEYAHAQGIIHRDLKPHNVMIDATGRLCVMDFGLAKNVRGESQITMSGTIIGTPSYMPPEQAEGKLKQLDRRSDVYSLGAILYEMLTGRPPFKGATPLETLSQVVNREVSSLTSLVASIPADLETVVIKCLEKDKERRYPSARLLADDLKRWLRGEGIAARRASIMTRVGKKVTKNKAGVIAGAAVAVALVVIVAVVMAGRSSSEADRTRLLAEGDAAFAKGEWSKAEVLYQKAEAREKAKKARQKIEESEAAAKIAKERDDREKKKREDDEARERDREANAKKARDQAQPAYDAGRRKLEEATRNLYRPGADLSRLEADLEESVREFSKAVLVFPDYHEALYQRGLAHFLLQNLEEAETDFTKAISLQKNFSDAYYERGRLYLERATYIKGNMNRVQTQTKEVEAYQSKARADLLEFNRLGGSGSDQARYASALLAYSEKRYDEALKICGELIAANTTNELVFKLKGDILLGTGQRMEEALAAYDEAIRRRVNFFEAYMLRGNVRYQLNDLQGALDDYASSVKINGRFSGGYCNRGVILTALNRIEEGRRELEKAVQVNPKDSVALYGIGVLEAREQRYAAAVEFYNRAIDINPEYAIAFSSRGAAKRSLHDYKGALDDYNQALQINPEEMGAYFNRAWLHVQSEDYESAIDDYTVFLAKWKGQASYLESARYSRATCYYHLKKYDDAIRDWEACLQIGTPRRADVEKWIDEARKRRNP